VKDADAGLPLLTPPANDRYPVPCEQPFPLAALKPPTETPIDPDNDATV